MALIFCRECNEPIAQSLDKRGQFSAWTYADKGYCPKHPAPAGLRELPPAGFCEWPNRLNRGHMATETWVVPRDGRRLCRKHLAQFVADVIHRGRYGERQ